MFDAAHAAKLLTATGAAGTAMDEAGQRRTVAGRGFGADAVADQHPAMERRHAKHDLFRKGRIIGEDRGDETALATASEINGLLGIIIGHDGADRAESLDVMHGLRLPWPVAIKQHRIEKGAGLGITGNDARHIGITGNDFRIAEQIADAGAHFIALVEAGKRTHADVFVRGIAKHRLAQPVAQGCHQRITMGARRDDTADGRAFLPGFRRHFTGNFLDEEIEFLGSGTGIDAEHGSVQAIGFHGEADGIADDGRMAL